MLTEGEYVAHFLDIVWYFQGLSKKRFSSIKYVSIYLLFLKNSWKGWIYFTIIALLLGLLWKHFHFFAVFQYKYNMYHVFTTDSQSKNLLILNSWIRNTLKMRLKWVPVIFCHFILSNLYFYLIQNIHSITTASRLNQAS